MFMIAVFKLYSCLLQIDLAATYYYTGKVRFGENVTY